MASTSSNAHAFGDNEVTFGSGRAVRSLDLGQKREVRRNRPKGTIPLYEII